MFLYRYLYPPKNGVIRFVSMEGKYGLLDMEFRIIAQGFDDMNMPASDLVPVRKDGLWGFIRTSGDWLLSPQFNHAGFFREGRCAICKDGAWGFIDNNGAMVVDPIYPSVTIFSEGLCAVYVKDVKNMYKSKRKTLKDETKFYEPPDKVKGHAKGWGYIDKFGEFVISPWFFQAGIFTNGLAIVKRSREGAPVFINKSGKIVLDCEQEMKYE